MREPRLPKPRPRLQAGKIPRRKRNNDGKRNWLRHADGRFGQHQERRRRGMGMILTGIVVAFAIAFGAGYYMSAQQEPSWRVFSTGSTRVGDPGHNLVGQNWTGEPGANSASAASGEETAS